MKLILELPMFLVCSVKKSLKSSSLNLYLSAYISAKAVMASGIYSEVCTHGEAKMNQFIGCRWRTISPTSHS